jgi:hypothetical protein
MRARIAKLARRLGLVSLVVGVGSIVGIGATGASTPDPSVPVDAGGSGALPDGGNVQVDMTSVEPSSTANSPSLQNHADIEPADSSTPGGAPAVEVRDANGDWTELP